MELRHEAAKIDSNEFQGMGSSLRKLAQLAFLASPFALTGCDSGVSTSPTPEIPISVTKSSGWKSTYLAPNLKTSPVKLDEGVFLLTAENWPKPLIEFKRQNKHLMVTGMTAFETGGHGSCKSFVINTEPRESK